MDPREFRRRVQADQDRQRDRPLARAECLERATAESPPERAALRHGLYLERGTLMPCDACQLGKREICNHVEPGGDCAIERQYLAERARTVRQVIQDDGADLELQEPLIMDLVYTEIDMARVRRHLAALGPFDPRAMGRGQADLQPAAKALPTLQNTRMKILDALNLTPAARVRLENVRREHRRGTLAAAVWELHRRDQERRTAQVQEAEFEVGEGERAE